MFCDRSYFFLCSQSAKCYAALEKHVCEAESKLPVHLVLGCCMLDQWETTEGEIISFWEQLRKLNQELPQLVLRGRTETHSRAVMESWLWGVF